jgi:hypothetical protein
MHQAMAPRRSRGGWRLTLALALASAFPLVTLAQSARKGASDDEPKAKASSKADDSAKEKDKEAKDKDDGGEAPAPKADPDVYLDPRARDLMENSFPELFKNDGGFGLDQLTKQVLLMARGTQPYDRNVITRFLRGQVSRLTSHRNIEAMMASPDEVAQKKIKPPEVQAISAAGTDLTDPLKAADSVKNSSFKRDYTAALLDKDIVPKLLSNHLYARTQAMLALSQTGEPQALDAFLAAIKDKDQPLSVKVLAFDGITNVARGGRRTVEPAIRAAQALALFLAGGEGDPFWPAQAHALQALGSLRLSTVDQNSGKFELAALAQSYLADTKRHPEVRANAAWALGMMRIIGQNAAQFNYPMIAQDMGQLAADLADRALAANIVATKQKDPTDVADYLTGLLVYQVGYALNRDPEIPNSGLVNSQSIGMKDKTAVQAVQKAVQAAASAAVELHRAVGAQATGVQKTLEARIKDLRTTLGKNAPAKRDLVLASP